MLYIWHTLLDGSSASTDPRAVPLGAKMDDRASVFGECDGDDGEFDVGRFAERLLLFDRVVLRSNRLREVTALCLALGGDGLTQLLNRGAVRFDCNAYGLGSSDRGPMSFELRVVRGQDNAARAAGFLRAALKALPDLREMQKNALRNAVERQLAELPKDFGDATLRHARRDLEANIPSIQTGALLAASELVGMKVRPGDLAFRVHGEDGTFRVESNLVRLGLDEAQAHSVARGALLAVAGTEYKLEQMKVHKSICIFREHDVAVLEDKLQYTWDHLNAGAQVRRFGRVLRLKNFPDFSEAAKAGAVDFARLLDARESDQCSAFRRWLRETDEITDEELQERTRTVREMLGDAARSVPGKLVRLAVTTGAGLVPVVGIATGAAASAVDSFLVEKLLPRSGAHAFLDDAVRSILNV